MALAQQPLLLLDEPFAGLAAEERITIQSLLGAISRDVTVLMIEHDMDVALTFADRVTLLHAPAGGRRSAHPGDLSWPLSCWRWSGSTRTTATAMCSTTSRLVLADCGAAFSEPGRQAFRNMSAAAAAKGLEAIADVAMRRLFAPELQATHPELIAQRRERFPAVHARFQLLPGCAHVPQLQAPQQFLEAIEPFLAA